MPYKSKKQQKAAQRSHYEENKEQYKARDKARIEKCRAFILEIKQNSECIDCGEDRWQCLDFDHRDPSEKLHSVCDMARKKYSIKTIQKEIDKCDVRCANCHRIRTYKEGHYKT